MNYKEDIVWVAMSDKTRRDILSLLEKKDMSAGEIAKHFSISKPSISHHLNIMKQAGFINAEKSGQNIIYSFSPNFGDEILAFIDRFQTKKSTKRA